MKCYLRVDFKTKTLVPSISCFSLEKCKNIDKVSHLLNENIWHNSQCNIFRSHLWVGDTLFKIFQKQNSRLEFGDLVVSKKCATDIRQLGSHCIPG